MTKTQFKIGETKENLLTDELGGKISDGNRNFYLYTSFFSLFIPSFLPAFLYFTRVSSQVLRIFVSSQSSNVEALMPNVIVFGGD